MKKLNSLKDFKLNREQLKKIKGQVAQLSDSRDLTCLTLRYQGEYMTKCDTVEVVNAWAHVWVGFGATVGSPQRI